MPLPSITNPADLIRHPDAPSSVGTNAFEKLLLVMSYLCHSMQTIQMEVSWWGYAQWLLTMVDAH